MLYLITPPATEPLTVNEVKTHLRLDSSNTDPAPDAATVALSTGAGNVDNGAHRYIITFTTADGETDAGDISAPVTVVDKTVNGQISLTNIPLGDYGVTGRKIYRTMAGGENYFYLATISDNTTVIYNDNIADASLGSGLSDDNTTGDPYLYGLITAARNMAESITKRKFITQTWEYKTDYWPTNGKYNDCNTKMYIPLPDLITVNSVKYIDQTLTLQTFDPALYEVQPGYPGLIQLVYGNFWPSTRTGLNSVTINFTCGFGSSRSNVPGEIKQAMLMMISHWYYNREDVVVGSVANKVPQASEYLLATYIAAEFSN